MQTSALHCNSFSTDSGRLSVRNDELSNVGQTEADYISRSDSIILDLS